MKLADAQHGAYEVTMAGVQGKDVEEDGGLTRIPSTEVEYQQDTTLGDQASISGSGTQSDDWIFRRRLFLNFEVLNPKQHKIAQLIFVFVLFLIVLALAAGYVLKAENFQPQSKSFTRIPFQVFIALASCCLFCATGMLIWFVVQLIRTRHCTWTRRHKYLAYIAFLQVLFQFVAMVFWVAANAHVLLYKCAYMDKFVYASAYIRFACYNTVFFLQAVHVHNCSPTRQGPKRSHKEKGDDESSSDEDENKVEGVEKRKDPMVLDGNPIKYHWWKAVFWALGQAFIIILAASGGSHVRNTQGLTFGPCRYPVGRTLKVNPLWSSFRIVLGVWFTIYLVGTAAATRFISSMLRKRPYNTYKFANLLLLWQRRLAFWGEVFVVTEISTNFYGDRSIVAIVQSLLGQMALQLMTTVSTILTAFYFLPMEPGNEEHMYQAWLQEFAWAARDIQRRQKNLVKQLPHMNPRLRQQPIFCMETALKMVLWSSIVYESECSEGHLPSIKGIRNPESPPGSQKMMSEGSSESIDSEAQLEQSGTGEESIPGKSEGGEGGETISTTTVGPRKGGEEKGPELSHCPTRKEDSKGHQLIDNKLVKGGTMTKETAAKVDNTLSGEQQLELAMEMYHLTEAKVIEESIIDTKAVISWNKSCMVIAFRGTASMKNACTDAKALRKAHPPRRGIYVLGSQPLIHQGFLAAWLAVQEPVMDLVGTVIDSASIPREDFKVFVTGHSLGGALALLASWQIQDKYHLPHLACYTFGAPRPGNAPFAHSYQQLVPDTWNVINDRDAVPRTGKLMVMYKRPGDRVLINTLGDIRVRPTVFEVNLHTSGYSVKQHLLGSYLDALGSIIVAQVFKSKAIDGGLSGAKRLAKMPDICRLLNSNGINLQLLMAQRPKHVQALRGTSKKRWKWKKNLAAVIRELQEMPLTFQGD